MRSRGPRRSRKQVLPTLCGGASARSLAADAGHSLCAIPIKRRAVTMSPACYRHFLLLAEIRPPRDRADEVTTAAARLVFAAIMAAPDLPTKSYEGRT